jgi:hypothetical protein
MAGRGDHGTHGAGDPPEHGIERMATERLSLKGEGYLVLGDLRLPHSRPQGALRRTA